MKRVSIAVIAVLALATPSLFAVNQGWYTGGGIQRSIAKDESDLDLIAETYVISATDNSRLLTAGASHVNGKLGIHLREGYKPKPFFGYELDVLLYGESSDLLAFNFLYSPLMFDYDRLFVRAGVGYTDNRFLGSYGVELEHEITPRQSVSVSAIYQPTIAYLHTDPDCATVIDTSSVQHTLCDKNLSDNKKLLGVVNYGLSYQYYFQDQSNENNDGNHSSLGHYLSLGVAQVTTVLPNLYDDKNGMSSIWNYETMGLALTRGFRFNPYYSLEVSADYLLSRGNELYKRHLAFWGFDHRFDSRSYSNGLFNFYGKVGSFYSSDRQGGISYGVGMMFHDGPKGISFSWERLDYQNGVNFVDMLHYVNLFGVKGYYRLSNMRVDRLNNIALPFADEDDFEDNQFFMQVQTGTNATVLQETSQFADQRIPINGLQGQVGFGLRHQSGNNLGVAVMAGVASNSGYHLVNERSAPLNEDALAQWIANHLTSDDDILRAAGRVGQGLSAELSAMVDYSFRDEASVFGQLGIAHAAWSVESSYGIAATSQPQLNSINLASGTGNLRSNGLLMAVGEIIPLAPSLGLVFRYAHARFGAKQKTALVDQVYNATPHHTALHGKRFRYKATNDQFTVGAHYYLKDRYRFMDRVSHAFSKGPYLVVSSERDLHFMTRSFVENSAKVESLVDDAFASMSYPSAYIRGQGVRGTMGYQWLVTPHLQCAAELTLSVHRSSHKHNFIYRPETWRYKAPYTGGVRTLLAYSVTPSARTYVHGGIIASQFSRKGMEGSEINFYEENFSETPMGFAVGFGSELALTNSLGLRLEYDTHFYEGFGVGDTREKGSLQWNYYRMSGDNYSLGLRFSL